MSNKRKFQLCIFIISFQSLFYLSSTSVQFNQDGYNNVIVKIPNSFNKEVLVQLQELFQTASSLLYTATNHKAFYNEVNFLFDADASFDFQQLPEGGRLRNASSMTLGRPVFTFSSTVSEIRTRQNIFCQQVNDGGIVLPSDVSKINSRDLVRNWVKYRYGVFDEVPLSDGVCYLDGNEQFKLTGCYDVNHRPSSLQVDSENGAYSCTNPESIQDLFGPDAVVKMKSSLMWSTTIPSVTHFCTDETHNKLAPTKHNLFCNGRSVNDVIESSIDFQNVGTSNYYRATFYYIQAQLPRVIFLLQNKINQKRSKITKAVLEFFHKYLIEEGVEVGVVTFNDQAAKTAKNLTIVKPIGERSFLLGSYVSWAHMNFSSDLTNSSVLGVEEAMKMFGDDQRINVIVLIGDAKAMMATTIYPMTRNNARVFLLPYLDKGKELELYQDLASGSVPIKDIYPLVDEPNEFGQELLHVALMDIFNTASGSKRLFLLYKKNHVFDGEDRKLEDVVVTSGKIDGLLVFRVSCDREDSNDDVSFNGEEKRDKPFDFLVTLTAKDTSEPEKWNFTITTNSVPNKCLILAFIIQSNLSIQDTFANIQPNPDQRIILNVDAFGNQESNFIVEVINLMNDLKYTVKIFDDGHDPDLTHNDGFYSGYFSLGSETNEGLYFLKLKESTQAVSRYDYLGFVAIHEKQVLPPGRIVDLKIDSVNYDRSQVSLSWSETRTPNYASSLTQIEVKYGIRWEDLEEEAFNVAEELHINSTHHDSNFTGKVVLVCDMPSVDDHFYLAVRARNTLHNVTSWVSNRVRVINGNLLTTTTPPVDGTTISIVTPDVTSDKSNCNCSISEPPSNSDEPPLSRRTLILIIASSLTVFFIFVIICNLVVCWACVKDNALSGWYKFKRNPDPITVNRRSSSNQSSMRRRSIRNSTISRPSSTVTVPNLHQRPDITSDWVPTPNHLINHNARRSDSPSEFIVVSNDSPRTNTNDSRSTTPARTLRQPRDAITFVSPGSRRTTTQNRLVFDGSSPAEDLYAIPNQNSLNLDVEAVNPVYGSVRAARQRPNEVNAFDLGEV